MTLFNQLFLGVSALFLVLLGGVEAIYVESSRTDLQGELASQAQDAATTLAMRLGPLGTLDDKQLVDRIVSPVFDRGYFGDIRVLDPEGKQIVRKTLPQARGDVPDWFTRAFPINAPGAQSLVSSGWRELGRVVVVSHPNFTYQRLWHTGGRTAAWLALVYLAAIVAARAFLGMLLRPLGEIERVAISISERNFQKVASRPRSRELARVVTAINSMSGKIGQAIEEESGRNEQLRRATFMDPLTSLYNRRGFEQQLESRIQSRSDVFSGSLGLVEITNFGAFNSRVGYARGDEVIKAVAAALAEACADHDAFCARLSGAGFALAAFNIDAAGLSELVKAACRRVGLALAAQGTEADLHWHCGATRHEGELPALASLLASADRTLQRAREKGLNEYEIEAFDGAADGGSRAWRARIEQALDEDRLVLFSQAVMSLPARQLLHREITVRLVHKGGEPIPAAQFLPMAIRHGLIGRLDCRVVEMLLSHLSRDLGPAGSIAVNTSIHTLADQAAMKTLVNALTTHRRVAGRLVFELTEFGALQEPVLARRFGETLRQLGSRLAIDNFSMDRDSLMLIHALKPHYIKLSASYVRELPVNPDCRFLVSSLVRIAQALEISIFAQAVEDEASLPMLEILGFSGYQGFAAARPGQLSGG